MKNYLRTGFFIALLLLIHSLKAQDITTNLVAYYPFNGNAQDAVGSLNGTLVGNTALTTDRLGAANSAYTFDGAGDWMSFTAAPTTIVDNWTVAAWVNPATLNQLSMAVNVGFDDCLGKPSCGYGFGMGNGGGGSGNNLQGKFALLAWINSVVIQ